MSHIISNQLLHPFYRPLHTKKIFVRKKIIVIKMYWKLIKLKTNSCLCKSSVLLVCLYLFVFVRKIKRKAFKKSDFYFVLVRWRESSQGCKVETRRPKSEGLINNTRRLDNHTISRIKKNMAFKRSCSNIESKSLNQYFI